MSKKIIHLSILYCILVISLIACGSSEISTLQQPQIFPQGAAVQANALASQPQTAENSVAGEPSARQSQPAGETAEVQTASSPVTTENASADYVSPIVDTGQTACYDASGAATACPTIGAAFYGQDAQYSSNTPSYTNNADGTITDNVTGLMWQQSPDTDGDGVINATDKLTFNEAIAAADVLTLAGYDDWRLPTITELHSLTDFSGIDISGFNGTDTTGFTPFIDTNYFDFGYGDTSAGERLIDAQFATSTQYVSTTMNGNETMFGVNFADGRIKGYGLSMRRREKTFYVLFVRGNAGYGVNAFVDNGDVTITDNATGLMWQQDDSGAGLNWEESLAYCTDLSSAGYDDWRLPNVKELQSLVDYGRSPDTTNSAAINPLFSATQIINEAGQPDYAAYWSSTTHVNMVNGKNADYVNFGRSMGYMNGTWIDVHGAGAQRSDPKTGNPAKYPTGHGPQGDAIRIDNYVRCVRDGTSGEVVTGGAANQSVGSSDQLNSNNNQPPSTNTQPAAGTGQPAGPNRQPPDLAAAAGQLGVSEDALRSALGDPSQGPPNFAAAAQHLGITESDLMAALGIAEGGMPPAGQSPPTNTP